MLAFYLKRRLDPPDDVMAEARTRALNLPIVHAVTVLIRYELVTFWIACTWNRRRPSSEGKHQARLYAGSDLHLPYLFLLPD